MTASGEGRGPGGARPRCTSPAGAGSRSNELVEQQRRQAQGGEEAAHVGDRREDRTRGQGRVDPRQPQGERDDAPQQDGYQGVDP